MAKIAKAYIRYQKENGNTGPVQAFAGGYRDGYYEGYEEGYKKGREAALVLLDESVETCVDVEKLRK